MAAPGIVPAVVPGPPPGIDPPTPDTPTSTSSTNAPFESSSTAVASSFTVPIQSSSSPPTFTLTLSPDSSSRRPSSSNAKQPIIIVFSIFGSILFLSTLACLVVAWIRRKNRKKRGLDIRPGKESSNNEEEYLHWPSTRPLGVGPDKAIEGYMSLSWSDARSSLARDRESSIHQPHHRLTSGGSHATGRSLGIREHDPEGGEGHLDLSPLDDDLRLTIYPIPPRDATFYSPVQNEQYRDPFADETGSPGPVMSLTAGGTTGETEKMGTMSTTSMMGRSAHTQVSNILVTSPSDMREVSNLPASVRREGR